MPLSEMYGIKQTNMNIKLLLNQYPKVCHFRDMKYLNLLNLKNVYCVLLGF